MAVYYLQGTSNYGDSSGLTGYYYPLYTDSSLIDGLYHSHTFAGFNDVIFYMPKAAVNHARKTSPSAAAYKGETYQEFTLDTAVRTQTITATAAYVNPQIPRTTTRTANVESSRVEDLIPIQLRESSETLISLLNDYYDYLNSVDQASNIFNRIVSEQDIDETSLSYLDRLQHEIAKTVPESRTLDKVSLYKKIVKYYSIRGSEESVLVFFRIFFDELAEVVYPKDLLFKPSDGDWTSSDNITNYNNFVKGYTNVDSSLSVDNLNDFIKFKDSNSLDIATGQITRIENLTPPKTGHPVTTGHIIEIDATEENRYDNTNLNEVTFKPFSPFVNLDAQSTGYLNNGVGYSSTEGFEFTDAPGGSSYERNHVDFGQIYNSENITDTTNAFSMVARVKPTNNDYNSAVMEIFNGDDSYPKHALRISSKKMAFEAWPWGSFYGYASMNLLGTTEVPLNEWSTVASRGLRDPNATAEDGGVGYIEVSVNGESWERIWDDADYGTPTSFSINHILTSATFDYSISGFTETGTKNGKPRYFSAGTNLSNTGSGTDSILENNKAQGFEIYFDPNAVGASVYGWPADLAIANDPGIYGVWILRLVSGLTPYVVWYDVDNSVSMFSFDTYPVSANITLGDRGIESQVPEVEFRSDQTELDKARLIGSGSYSDGPNDSGEARGDFFSVLKDYNRQLKDSNGVYTERKPAVPAIGISVFFGAEPNGNQVEFVSDDKHLTWRTTNEMLDVQTKAGHLRLGVRRWNHYYRGKILHASYFQKLISAGELGAIKTYHETLNRQVWGLRVSVDNDTPLLGVSSISDSNNTYSLTDLSSPLIDSFWTYDESSYGTQLSGFTITSDNGGVINWGDGSEVFNYSSNIPISHTFAPSSTIEGSYGDRKGFISDINKLQDSNYWQDYSYEIRSGLQTNEWINEYLRLVHPSGMKLFAALLIQVSRLNKWTGPVDGYRAQDPQEATQLKGWLEKLIAPWKIPNSGEAGYHMPFYQPGWLDADNRTLQLLAEALVHLGIDPRSGGTLFDRTVLVVLHFLIESNTQTRDQLVLEQQQLSQKFLDTNIRTAEYAGLTANELGNSEFKLIPSQSHESNILADHLPWSLGTGNDDSYGTDDEARWLDNGDAVENNRTWRSDPFGNLSITWVATDKDSASNNEGGFHSPVITIDASQNKTYRFSVWMKQQNDNGSKYFGLYARDTGGDITANDSILTAAGVATSNPYFRSVHDLPQNDTWYLLVGFLRPNDSSTASELSDSFGGTYDTNGNRVNDIISEYKYLSDVNGLRIRGYHFYNTENQGDEVEMWGPRIDVVDGKEPSVQELIFPTIDPNILYGNLNRPKKEAVYKLNNVSVDVIGLTTDLNVDAVMSNDVLHYNQQNYNENLKFIDSSHIGSYYEIQISDMSVPTESGYIVTE